MSSSHVIRLGSIKKTNGILHALRHNKRTIPADFHKSSHIDLLKSHLNYSLLNDFSPEDIAKEAKILIIRAGIDKVRINQVMGVEIIFSLPISYHCKDTRKFFKDCFNWVRLNFKGTLLSFDIHLDESAPHAHAIFLPLIDGKMQGNAMMGNNSNLMRIIRTFHSDVACHHGLSHLGSKKISALDKKLVEKLVLENLETDPVKKSRIWGIVRDDIHKNPLIYAQQLSIEWTPEKKEKTIQPLILKITETKSHDLQTL